MSDSPLVILLLFAGAVYLFKIWLDDYRQGLTGDPNPRALPGATKAPLGTLVIAGVGALLLVGVETAGELALGVSAEQSDITVIFLFAMIGAGILEEVLFRGYLVVRGKGAAVLVASIVGFSLLFSLAHYQYYTEIPEDGGLMDATLAINAKASWSLFLLFINSLWFYTVRFFRWNPLQSLLPCFVAHIASNLGVFMVKLLQGHVTAWY